MNRFIKRQWYFQFGDGNIHFPTFFLALQDQVPNILMTGFLQILEQKSKKRRGDRFLQLRVELLNTLESIFQGLYL